MMNVYQRILATLAAAVVGGACDGSWKPEDFHAALRDPEHAIWDVPAPAVFRARFETSTGDFVMEVHRDWAPIGADRLYNLVPVRSLLPCYFRWQ